MNICLVSCAFAPIHGGGVAVSLSHMAKEFVNFGLKVSVFTIDNDVRKKDGALSIRIIERVTCYIYNAIGSNTDFFDRYKQKDYYNKKIERAFSKIVRDTQFDIVHFHAIQGMGANLLNVPTSLGIKSFVSFHDFWWVCPNLFYTDHHYKDCSKDCSTCHIQLRNISENYKTENIFYNDRRVYLLNQLKKADGVFSNSRYLISEIEFWGLKNIVLNENGVDIPLEANRNKNSKSVVIGFVGGQNELKGYSIVVSAFNSINDSNLELHVYGTDKMNMGTWYANLKKATKVNGIRKIPSKLYKKLRGSRTKRNEKIKLFGTYGAKEKYRIFSSFDVLIVGTRVKESFSLVTREAQILQIPVITSDCGGPLDIIKEGVNGYIYERNSSVSLKNAIVRFLDDRRIGKKYQFSQKIKTINEQAQELLEHYAPSNLS